MVSQTETDRNKFKTRQAGLRSCAINHYAVFSHEQRNEEGEGGVEKKQEKKEEEKKEKE